MENKFTRGTRKATIVKKEVAEIEATPRTETASVNISEKKMEIYREILNFKDVISNDVLSELNQSQCFSGFNQQQKIRFKTNLESIVSKHLDNLINRIQKKI